VFSWAAPRAGASVPKAWHGACFQALVSSLYGGDVIVTRHALAAVLVAVAVGACEFAPSPQAPQTLEGLGVEFQAQPPPGDLDLEATLRRIRLEFGVGLDRAPDAVTFGTARCLSDPACFGDVGSGPLRVWLIEWDDDQGADSGGRLLVDATSGALLRFE
jgi:hypothetical protein